MRKVISLFIVLVLFGCASAQPKYTPEQLQLKQFRESVLLRGELPPELQNLAQLSPEQYRTERENLIKRLGGKAYTYIKYKDWPRSVNVIDFIAKLDAQYCHAQGGIVLGQERFSCVDKSQEEGWIIGIGNKGMGLCQTANGILFARGHDRIIQDESAPLYVTQEEIHQWFTERLSKETVGRHKLALIINHLKEQPDMTYIPLYDEVSQKVDERTAEGLLKQEIVKHRVVAGRAIKLNAHEYLLSIDDPGAGIRNINLFHVVLCPPGYHVRRGSIKFDLQSVTHFRLAGYTHSDLAQYLKLNEISAHFGLSLLEAHFLEDKGNINLNDFALRIFTYLQGKNIWFANYNFLGGKDIRILSPDTIQVQGALTERQLMLIRYILGPSQFDRVKGSGPWLIDATFRIPQDEYSKPELLALSVKELIR